MSLRDHMQAIYDQYGKMTPSILVQAATPDDHPLHSRFEWDDTIAGPKYRLVQARDLIRSLRVVYKPATSRTEERSVRAWQAVYGDSDEFVYEPAEKVASDEFLTALVLRDMERDWKQLKARYGHFTEFVAMIQQDIEAA